MKKKKKRKLNPRFVALMLVPALLLAVLLVRCAAAVDPAAGNYSGFGFFADGQGWLCGNEFSVHLNNGGKGSLTVFGTKYTIQWKRSGDTVTIKDGSGKYECPYEDGILTMTLEAEEGTVTVIFTQDGVYSFETDTSATLGSYHVTRCYDSTGKDYAPQSEVLTLYDGGLGSFYAYGYDDPLTWTLDGTALTVTMDGTETTGICEDGTVSIELGGYLYDLTLKDTNAAVGSYTCFGYTADGVGWTCKEGEEILFTLNEDYTAEFSDSNGTWSGTWTDTDSYTFLPDGASCPFTYDEDGLLTLTVESGDSVTVYYFTQDGVYSESDGDEPAGSYTCTACYDSEGNKYAVEGETLTLCTGGIGKSYLMGYDNLVFWDVRGDTVKVVLDDYSDSDDFSDGVITLALGNYIYDFEPD